MTVLNLSETQRAMVIASAPDDVTGREGLGVDLASGGAYATAKSLERLHLGHRVGPGGFLPGMYWNNADGLAVRELLLLAAEVRR